MAYLFRKITEELEANKEANPNKRFKIIDKSLQDYFYCYRDECKSDYLYYGNIPIFGGGKASMIVYYLIPREEKIGDIEEYIDFINKNKHISGSVSISRNNQKYNKSSITTADEISIVNNV